MNIQHVYPINDTDSHDLFTSSVNGGDRSCPCKCKPRYEYPTDDSLIVIHSSFDGREGVEWANEILNNT